MGIINLITRKSPTIAGFTFDAVLDDNYEASVEITQYPVESGARINDHRIINPQKWTMTGAVGNQSLTPSITDFAIGGLSNLTGNPLLSGAAGLAIGFLAGSDETKASSALECLIYIMNNYDPFDVDAGDIQLKNMAITRLSRAKDPTNENGLIFIAEMQEVITLDRIARTTQPKPAQLRAGDVSQTGIAGLINSGEKALKTASAAVTSKVNSVLGSIF